MNGRFRALRFVLAAAMWVGIAPVTAAKKRAELPPPVAAISDGHAEGAMAAYLDPGGSGFHLLHHEQRPEEVQVEHGPPDRRRRLVYRHRLDPAAWSEPETIYHGEVEELDLVVTSGIASIVYRLSSGLYLVRRGVVDGVEGWLPPEPLSTAGEVAGPFALTVHGDEVHLLVGITLADDRGLIRRLTIDADGVQSDDVPCDGKPVISLVAAAAAFGWDHLIYESESSVMVMASSSQTETETESGDTATLEPVRALPAAGSDEDRFIVLDRNSTLDERRFKVVGTDDGPRRTAVRMLYYTKIRERMIPRVMLPRPDALRSLSLALLKDRPVLAWSEAHGDSTRISIVRRPGNRFAPPAPIRTTGETVHDLDITTRDGALVIAVIDGETLILNRFSNGFWGDWHRPPGADRESSWLPLEVSLFLDAHNQARLIVREELSGPLERQRIVEWVSPPTSLIFNAP